MSANTSIVAPDLNASRMLVPQKCRRPLEVDAHRSPEPLRAAEGIVTGLVLSAAVWAVIVALVVWL